jgi:hypothetical protein
MIEGCDAGTSRGYNTLISLNKAGHGFMHEMESHGGAEAGVAPSRIRDLVSWSCPLQSRSMMQF